MLTPEMASHNFCIREELDAGNATDHYERMEQEDRKKFPKALIYQ